MGSGGWLYVLAVLACSGFLVVRYAAPSASLASRLVTFLAWGLAFSVPGLLPVDVAGTFEARCPTMSLPQGGGEEGGGGATEVAWLSVYWAMYVLTWAALPLHQGYEVAGAFSFRGRLRESMQSNIRFYALLVALVAGGIVWLLFTGALSGTQGGLSLQGLAIALPNAFGLAVSILLLAYGLIETPRGMWIGADPPRRLRDVLSKLASTDDTARECEGELARCLGVASYADGQVPDRAPHRPAMEVVLRMANAASTDARGGVAADQLNVRDLSSEELDYDLDESSLESLNVRLRLATCAYQRVRAQHSALVSEAVVLDDIVKAQEQGTSALRCAERTVQRWEALGGDSIEGLSSGTGRGNVAAPFSPSLRDRAFSALASSPLGLPTAATLWVWRLHAAPTGARIAASLLGCASVCVIVAEATLWFGRRPDLSAYSYIVHSLCPCGDILNLAYSSDEGFTSSSMVCSGEAVQLAILLPLAYVVFCAYSSLFRLSFFHYYALTPGYSDGYSLLVSSGLLCRFIVPLVFNYLRLVHVDDMAVDIDGNGHGVPTTAFAKTMVPMDMVPLLGDFINVYFPATLVVFCVAVQYDWTGKAAKLVGYGSSLFSSDEGFAQDEVDRGRSVLENFRFLQVGGKVAGVSFRGHVPAEAGTIPNAEFEDYVPRPGETVSERIQRYRDRKERRVAARATAIAAEDGPPSLSFTDRLRGFVTGSGSVPAGGGGQSQELASSSSQNRDVIQRKSGLATQKRGGIFGSDTNANASTLDSIFARVDRSRRTGGTADDGDESKEEEKISLHTRDWRSEEGDDLEDF